MSEPTREPEVIADARKLVASYLELSGGDEQVARKRCAGQTFSPFDVLAAYDTLAATLAAVEAELKTCKAGNEFFMDAGRMVDILKEENATLRQQLAPAARTYYVAACNASGGPEMLRVRLNVADDDADGDFIRDGLEAEGYDREPTLIFGNARFFKPTACFDIDLTAHHMDGGARQAS